jgi:hypothetical protein
MAKEPGLMTQKSREGIMNHWQSKLTLWLFAISLMLTAGMAPVLAKAQATSPGTGSAAAKPAAPASSGKPSSSEIADAKQSGKVWVNTESGVYHKGGRWYGKTKAGKFMTESDAKAAGYKPAKAE